MLVKRELPPNSHEIAKLEAMVKFLYFLRDIGVRSAHPLAVAKWKYYMHIVSELAVGGSDAT